MNSFMKRFVCILSYYIGVIVLVLSDNQDIIEMEQNQTLLDFSLKVCI